MEWICAIIGFAFFQFPGAILGYFIGYLFKQASGGISFFDNQTKPFQGSQGHNVTSADFELHLLSLCSLVIRANGVVTQAELDFVRMQFVQMYGKERANAVFRKFNELVKGREISAQRVATYVRARTTYETRLQIIYFLFGIAKADGKVSDDEVQQIREISYYFFINSVDFESIKAMFVGYQQNYQQTNEYRVDAYKILGVSSSATEAEVKRAYRDMAKKYHPDKVITDDEAIKKGAEEKFKQVQQAYDQICRERGWG